MDKHGLAQNEVDQIKSIIDRSERDLNRIAGRLPLLMHDIDAHDLCQSLKSDVDHQATKARVISVARDTRYSQNALDKFVAMLSKAGVNEESNPDMKYKQMTTFKVQYFKWAKDLLEELKSLKHTLSIDWLDLSGLALKLGNLEL